MILIKEASVSDITIIQGLAEVTWWNTYSTILAKEQINYMLKTLYSAEVLKENIEKRKQKFLVLYTDNGAARGFAAYGINSEDARVGQLYKLYVHPDENGKGYGRKLVDEVKKRLRDTNISALELNVNRYNSAKLFYEKIGFKVVAEKDIPIGNFWMNDYIMRTAF